MADKMAIIVFSGTVDKLMAAATLATGGAAMGLDVDLFVTFWGLDAFRKDVARSNTKISADFAEFRDVMMERMEEKKVPHWLDVLEQAREIGNVRVRACSQTMELFGWTLDDLEPIVEDVTGVAVFVDEAKDADIQLFI